MPARVKIYWRCGEIRRSPFKFELICGEISKDCFKMSIMEKGRRRPQEQTSLQRQSRTKRTHKMLQVRSPYWVLPAHPTCWKLGDAWLSLVRSEFVQRDSTQTAGRNSVLWHLTVDQRGTRTGHPGLWYFAFQFNGLWNLQKRFRGFNLFQGLARVTKRRCCTSHLSRKSGIKCYCCGCSRSSERWCVRKL